MPTYEYVCTDCQNQWEEVQKISEDPLQDCPKCGKPTAKRQISGGNFILKGGGWYADLYSSPKKSNGSEAPGASSEKKSESTAPKADTSPSPSGGGSSSSSSSSGSSSSGGASGSGSGSGSSKPSS
jgi:putative FmdB family regulatory protein